MKKHIKTYIAGLFDGEGSVTYSYSHKNDIFRIPMASISSTSIELLTFIKQHYGGSISNQKVYKSHHKKSWSWKLSHQKALYFFKDIYPYILVKEKRYRIKLLLTEYDKFTKRNGKYTDKEKQNKLKLEYKFFHPKTTITTKKS